MSSLRRMRFVGQRTDPGRGLPQRVLRVSITVEIQHYGRRFSEGLARELGNATGMVAVAHRALKRVAAEEVFDERGRVLGPALARVLDVSLGRVAKSAHLTERALRSNPASERLQKPGRKIAALLARLDHVLGARRSTLIWLKSPRPQLADASPLDLLLCGDYASVETLVHAVESGQSI